jgi:signal transduction histidine kinase
VRLTEYSRSTYFRFAVLLAATFLLAYALAAWVALRVISADLDSRVEQAAELTAERLEDAFERGGEEELVRAIETRSASADPDDEVYWLGRDDGEMIAGRPVNAPLSLMPGNVGGSEINADIGDRYRIATRDIGDTRLIVAFSFEEPDAILHSVIGAFALASLTSFLIAGMVGTFVAQRAQGRLTRIADTLRRVARGDMKARVPHVSARDDLGRLSLAVNDGLEQLENTVDGIRQVSTDIAHDLRTPINRLEITLERMRDVTHDTAALNGLADDANAQAKQIATTFDALLRIAEIEAGARKSRFQAVSLSEIAERLHEAYTPVAEEAGMTFDIIRSPQSGDLVLGDRYLLTQLFANLIENAIRHCPTNSTIQIETGTGLNGVWINVRDNGPGIAKDERDRVLRRFYRVEKSRTTPGSGLGLALVKAISDLHGARLSLDDNMPGLRVRLDFAPFDRALVHAS